MKKVGIIVLVVALLIVAYIMFAPKSETTDSENQSNTNNNVGNGVNTCPQVSELHKGYAEHDSWWQDAASSLKTIGYTIEQVHENDNKRRNQLMAFAKGYNIRVSPGILQFYKPEILQYISSNGSHEHWNIEVGDFVCASNGVLP